MASVRKCPKCGLDLTDTAVARCPICGTSLTPLVGGKVWIGALVQFAFMSTFMLLFHFPKFMIVFFGIMIFSGASLRSFLKPANAARVPVAPPQLSRPALDRVISIGIALNAVVLFSIVLFSLVMCLNDWTSYQRYEGQPYHRSDFVVTQVYCQRHGKGGLDLFASGLVEGQREWMTLQQPYLQSRPRTQAELEEQVPVGTSIPVYLFPDLKGRSRIRIYQETPSAEAYRRSAISTLNHALIGIALAGGILFLLVRARRTCIVAPDSNPLLAQAAAAAKIN